MKAEKDFKKRIFLMAFLITAIIFLAIIFSNSLMENKREQVVLSRMDDVVGGYEDLQSLLLMTEFIGENLTCVALQDALNSMNKNLWVLGDKIDSYREATQNFQNDPFYLGQKEKFNRQEMLYFLMLKKMKTVCSVDKIIVSFFYKKKELCPDCDAQSFVLSNLRKDFENIGKVDEIALFSFDVDFGLPLIDLMTEYYNVDAFPCIVVESKKYCGLFNKDKMLEIFCNNANLSLCPKSQQSQQKK